MSQFDINFCIEYIVATFKTAIYEIRDFFFSYFVAFRTQRNIIILFCSARYVDCIVFKENLKLYILVIINLDFVVFSLICFRTVSIWGI